MKLKVYVVVSDGAGIPDICLVTADEAQARAHYHTLIVNTFDPMEPDASFERIDKQGFDRGLNPVEIDGVMYPTNGPEDGIVMEEWTVECPERKFLLENS